MSKKNWIWARVLVAVVTIGLLVTGGVLVYRAGWSQGYVASSPVVEGEEVEMPAPGFSHPGRRFASVPYPAAPFVFGAGFLKIGLLVLFLAVIGRMFRFVLWGPAGRFGMAGPRFRYTAARWRRMHGPVPPWCWGWAEPSEEQTGKVEPEADTGKAEA
jgi:hypothetical protein